MILRLREERQYGIKRLSMFLARYHQVCVSPPTIYRVLKEHHVPRVSRKRYRPAHRAGVTSASPASRFRLTSST